jgi:GTP-binding protein Era
MPRTGHIALAGAPNVGKSTLLNSLVGAHLALVSPKAQATRLPVVGLLTEDDTQYILHDLPGLLDPAYLMHHRMLAAAHELIRKADVILHLHPAPDAPAPRFAELAQMDRTPAAPVVMVYTKGDQVDAERRARLQQDAIVVARDDADSTKRLLGRVRELLPEREFAFEADDIGTQPLRFFVTEFIREAAFEFLEDELPYAIAAEVEEFREGTTPVYIRATIFVERESQKGIVLGRRGGTIRALGTHARARIEALLGAPVYLDLWVKVLPRWRKNARELTRFGFPLSAEESA